MNRLNRLNAWKTAPILVALWLGTWVLGCESKGHLPSAPAPTQTGTEAEVASRAKLLVLGTIELDQQRMPLPGDVDKDAFLASARKKLDQADYIDVASSGGNDLRLEVVIARLQGKPGADLQDITSLTAQLDDQGILRHYAVYTSHAPQGTTTTQAHLEQTLDALVRAIDQDRWVLTHPPKEIIAELGRRGDTFLPEEAAIRALRRVREVAGEGAEHKREVTGLLRRYLEHPQTRVVVAAAGSLVLLKDRSSQTAMIDAATTLNKQGDIPSYLTLLTLMGDLGGEQIAKYIEIVSQSHEQPSIQREAAKINERLKQRTAP